MAESISLPSLTSWNAAEKIAFRFSLIFLGLFIFPFPVDYLPYADSMVAWVFDLWDWIVVKTGKHVLHLPYDITVKPNGSGDTTWNYVQMFIILVLSVAGCIIWTAVDRKRKSYHTLFYWFTVAVRYYLSFTMFVYGFIKVFKTQFPYPGISRLLEPYGQSSPMGLAWAFLGYSKNYNLFMGGVEVLGGLLLLFRRTTTFGALFCMTVTVNIAAIIFMMCR